MELDKNRILYTYIKTYTVNSGKSYAPDIWLLTEKIDLRAVDCVDPIKYRVLNSNASHQLSELYRIRSLNNDYDILTTKWSSDS